MGLRQGIWVLARWKAIGVLHIDDFSKCYKAPEEGDLIQFSMGFDERGRTCAINAVQLGFPENSPTKTFPRKNRETVISSRNNGLHLDDIALLIFLLIAPAWALYRLALPIGITLVSAIALSAITFLTYVLDKVRAQSHDWRIPENTLHFLALIGGWPGAFLGQQHVRHKTAKISFQIVFWLIVFTWEIVAIDYLLDWKILHFIGKHLRG